MRMIALLLVAAAAPIAAACGSDQPDGQVATFTAADPQDWEVGDHPLGRGELEPANVGFGPEGLTLSLPAGTTDGGEIVGTEWRGDGSFLARMQTAGSPGSISAFFLYRHDFETDSSDEIDFEIPGGEPHRALLTVWRRGIKTPVSQTEVPLDFDPSAAIHEYELRRAGSTIDFLIDGAEVHSFDEAPTATLQPYFNAWYPDWQEPAQPPAGGEVSVERYEYAP